MARVPYLERADVPPAFRHWLDRPINLVRALAHSPGGLREFQSTGSWIRNELVLDSRLRELAILQVGALAGSPYEFSHHLLISRDFGVSDADRRAISQPESAAGHLDATATLVVQAATEITRDCALSDETWAALGDQLGTQAAVELVLVVAHYNAVVRVLGALVVEVEPAYQSELERFPLPPAATS